MIKAKIDRYFDPIFITLFSLLLIGTPLLFTAITRSVFEVNKMLLLRIISIIIPIVWAYRTALYKQNNIIESNEDTKKIGPFRWQNLGIEVPIVIWMVLNVLSTVFSQNLYVSIIGSYDRWEGIITVSNYALLMLMFAKLINNAKHIKWIILATLIPASISAIYGVAQSIGLDFMNWSVDPSSRVFACINNPVHFCAYLAMIVPVAIGWILYMCDSNRKCDPNNFEIGAKGSLYAFVSVAFILSASIALKDSIENKLISLSTLVTWINPVITAPIIIGLISTGICIFSIKTLYQNSESWSKETQRTYYTKTLISLLNLCILFTLLIITNETFAIITFAITSLLSILGLFAIQKLNRISAVLKKHSLPTITTALTIILWALNPTFNIVVMILCIVIAWLCAINDSSTLANKKSILHWTLYGIGLMALSLFTNVGFDQSSLLILVAQVALFYIFSASPNWETVCKRGLLVLTTLIYYTQFLSYSRATWMGFIGSMTLFYLLATKGFDQRSFKHFFKDFLFTLVGISTLYLISIFNLYVKGPQIAIPILISMLAYIGYCIHISRSSNESDTQSKFLHFISISLMIITFMLDLTKLFTTGAATLLYIGLIIYFFRVLTRVDESHKKVISRLSLLLIFAKLQFISLSFIQTAIYFVLVYIYYKVTFEKKTEKSIWLTAFLIIFGVMIVIPSIPNQINTAFNQEEGELKAAKKARFRMKIYASDAIKGTARTSMWKSSFPWIKDHLLLGSGLDTIKFTYPKYRRPEYGILEGGHNFTPDRLHNEYLNTMASRGIPNFIVYYFFIIGSVVYAVCRFVYKEQHNPYRYLAIAFLTGMSIYLGQVMFNFGVVATLVLFYTYVGLAIGISRHSAFKTEKKAESSCS